LVTSVVMRVTRPAVLNLSILENENRWIFSYIPSRRLQAKPEAALAAKVPARAPQARLQNAMASIRPPYWSTLVIFPASIPWSISDAVMNGISTSISTSRAVNTGVRMESLRYCFTWPSKVIIINLPPLLSWFERFHTFAAKAR
jgi:hypothetical protein